MFGVSCPASSTSWVLQVKGSLDKARSWRYPRHCHHVSAFICTMACYVLLSSTSNPHHGEVNWHGEVSAAPSIHKTTASSHLKGYLPALPLIPDCRDLGESLRLTLTYKVKELSITNGKVETSVSPFWVYSFGPWFFVWKSGLTAPPPTSQIISSDKPGNTGLSPQYSGS